MVLIKELKIDPIDVLIVKASDENSVDVMREKIKGFVSTYAVGDFKVVLLDECDLISFHGQGVLRNLLDEFKASSRFILTCNYPHKVLPAIKSRLQEYRFKGHDKLDITELAAKILLSEKIKFDLTLLDKYVDLAYPDVRKTINLLQQYSLSGVLVEPPNQIEDSDYQLAIFDYLEKGQWSELRVHLCSTVAPEEWEDVYRFMYDNLDKAPIFSKNINKWEEGIITIAEYLYKHALVADPEINFAACTIRLQQIIQEK
jgi:DNA polymerase III delta prime subunit